jgi:hypothetical protein
LVAQAGTSSAAPATADRTIWADRNRRIIVAPLALRLRSPRAT